MGVFRRILEVTGFADEEEYYEEIVEEEEILPAAEKKERKVARRSDSSKIKVSVFEPLSFSESRNIAQNLKDGMAVVINLEKTEFQVGQRIIDFMGGVIFAIDGSMKKIGESIIIAAPASFDLGGEFSKGIAENKDDIFSWVSKFNFEEDYR